MANEAFEEIDVRLWSRSFKGLEIYHGPITLLTIHKDEKLFEISTGKEDGIDVRNSEANWSLEK